MVVVKDMEILRKDTVLAGLSYAELAADIGVSKTTIGSIYTGKRNPSPRVAMKICERLNQQFERYFFIETVHKKERREEKKYEIVNT